MCIILLLYFFRRKKYFMIKSACYTSFNTRAAIIATISLMSTVELKLPKYLPSNSQRKWIFRHRARTSIDASLFWRRCLVSDMHRVRQQCCWQTQLISRINCRNWTQFHLVLGWPSAWCRRVGSISTRLQIFGDPFCEESFFALKIKSFFAKNSKLV